MKTNNIILIALFLFLLLGTSACDKSEEKPKPPRARKNFLVVLDLSDRLLAREDQAERDKLLIKEIFRLFKEQARQAKYIQSEDRFQVLLARQQGMSVDRLSMEDALLLDLSRIRLKKKHALVKMENQLDSVLTELYTKASFGKRREDFKGADLWRFFHEDLNNCLLEGENIENYLFVLTDGYLDFEDGKKRLVKANRYTTSKFLKSLRVPNWKEKLKEGDYGLMIPNEKGFNCLSAMILEVHPKYNFQQEFSLLETIWSKWMEEMQVGNFEVVQQEGLARTYERMADFTQSQNKGKGI